MVTDADEPDFFALVNSEHIRSAEHVDDHLDDAGRLSSLLTRWRLAPSITAKELSKLRDLRALLRHAIEELMATAQLSRSSLAVFNCFFEEALQRVALRCSKDGALELTRRSSTRPTPSGYAAASFAEFVTSHDARRIKLCANAHCRWAFYDISKNRSKKWCSSAACGNLTKVRAFRERARKIA